MKKGSERLVRKLPGPREGGISGDASGPSEADRLAWTDGVSLVSYGVRVGIRTNDSGVLEQIKRRLPPGWKRARAGLAEKLYSVWAGGVSPVSGRRRFSSLYDDDQRIARSRKLEALLELLESSVRMYVARSAPDKIFVHAGAVGWRGRAIIIPGRSFSGKTSLVAELVRAGADYYSDEYAVFDARGLVLPFPKPLSLRLNGDVRQQDFHVEELGGRAGTKPLPVGLVVVSSYKKGARWRPRMLSPGQGALALLSNTVAARTEPARALATFQQVMSHALALKGLRGEASELVDSLLARCEESWAQAAHIKPGSSSFL